MPPAILNDSEDEDDDVVFDDGKGGSLSRSSGDQVANIADLDGTHDSTEQSTGSTGTISTSFTHVDILLTTTERIQRQMEEVQRSLFADSGEQARSGSGQTSARDSPTKQPLKRAYSVMDSAKPMTSMEKLKAKRQKTSNDIPTTKTGRADLETSGFFARFAQDARAARTSDPVRFSNHSGAGHSSGLPTGSLQADFVKHEPAVMFKGTGSTVAENSSSIDRMADEARHSKAEKSSTIKLVGSDEALKSSSFPWSVSEQTESAKPDRSKPLAAITEEIGTETTRNEPGTDAAQALAQDQESFARAVASSNFQDRQAAGNEGDQSGEEELTWSSPVVQLNDVHEVDDKTATAHSPATKPSPVSEPEPKTNRGRKRKVQDEASEPLNSDDIAVGLPKERYQPRPSKRRATQAAEAPIDYSIRPEKAAKSKRSKTTSHEPVLPNEIPESAEVRVSPEKDDNPKTKRLSTRKSSEADRLSTEEHNDNEAAKVNSAHESPSAALRPSPSVQIPAAASVTAASPQRPVTRDAQASSQASNDDAVFKKPLHRVKSATKPMRSKTTIFEDHVEFTGSQRSPSLSQQQAARASALQDVTNEATPAKPRRKAKRIVEDGEDENDDDELPPDDEEEPAPKKRGRGRPPKSAAKSSSKKPEKSAERVLDDSDGGDDEEIMVEPPKKRGRGRPPKNADKNEEGPEKSAVSMPQQSGRSPTPPRAFVEPLSPMVKSKPPTPERSPAATKIPTPSPEEQTPVKEAATPQKPARESPTSHSPIKQSSVVPLRVGLSKRYRIPSLLKMVRPPAPKREDPRAAARAKKKKEAEEARAREEGEMEEES